MPSESAACGHPNCGNADHDCTPFLSAARRSDADRKCRCGHRESEHRVGKTADFGGYCCAYVGVGGAGFRSWCQCPGFEPYRAKENT